MKRLDLTALDDPRCGRAIQVLEAGGLVVLLNLPFPLSPGEGDFLDPLILERGVKNISLDPASGRVAGARVAPTRADALATMLARYAAFAEKTMAALAPHYRPALQRGRTTFRPGPVDGRVLSARRDDRRLHLDAFAAKPVQGRRILRLFTNVDPEGRDRVWELGDDDLGALATRFSPELADPGLPARIQEWLGIIKSRRTAYDAAMLTLHDRAKLDGAWQSTAQRSRVAFPPGSTWAVFTDGVLHAALSGQHAFEQTWLLPVDSMIEPDRSPLRRLERIAGHPLT